MFPTAVDAVLHWSGWARWRHSFNHNLIFLWGEEQRHEWHVLLSLPESHLEDADINNDEGQLKTWLLPVSTCIFFQKHLFALVNEVIRGGWRPGLHSGRTPKPTGRVRAARMQCEAPQPSVSLAPCVEEQFGCWCLDFRRFSLCFYWFGVVSVQRGRQWVCTALPWVHSANNLYLPSPRAVQSLGGWYKVGFYMQCDFLRTLNAFTSLTSQPSHPWKSLEFTVYLVTLVPLTPSNLHLFLSARGLLFHHFSPF